MGETGYRSHLRLCLVALYLSGLASAQDLLTLDQAVAIAMEHSRPMRNANLDVNRAIERVAAARTRLYPSWDVYAMGSLLLRRMDFTFERGLFGTFEGIGPVPPSDTLVSTPRIPTAFLINRVSQPLSQIFRIKLNLRILELARDASREQLRAVRQETVQKVKQAYYAIQQTEASLIAVSETVRLYRELDRLTAEYVAREVALKGDHLEVQTRLAQVESDEITLTDQAAGGRERLNLLLGREVLTAFRVSPIAEPEPLEADPNAARQIALSRRPEIRQARLREQQAVLDRRSKRSEYVPDISLTFQGITLVNYNTFLPGNILSAGLLLTWQPFDWGRKKHELREKDYAIEQARLGLAETGNQVIIEVHDRLRRLRQTRALLRAAGLGRETAIERLRVLRDRFRLEAVLMKDVLQGQAALEEANTQYQQALLAFWTAKADFDKAIGEDQ